VGLFDLNSWLARSRSSPPSHEPERTDQNPRREAMICTRDHKLGKELSEILGERGYTSSFHRNPWAVRFAANRTPPNLVIIDWRVGEANAVKLASTLNNNPYGYTTSILAVVPSAKPDVLAKILEHGFNDFVMLPLDRAVLVARLRMIELRMRELDQMQALQKDIKKDYQRFLIASGGIGDGVWDLNLATNTVHLSDRWMEMLGYR
jgi:DNA-binding response OmpR family regulator